MTETTVPPSTSGPLGKATLIALLLAAVVLVTALLPAEYGIDPLRTGQALGLMDIYRSEQAAAEAAAVPTTVTPPAGGPLFVQLNDYRLDAREFTIPPYSGMEFKYVLNKSATMVYAWKASGFVDFDFHTEPAGKPPEASESFEKGEAAQKRGGYTAPYDGIHGWYWENKTDRDITVKLSAAGFFAEGKLFEPEQPPQTIPIPDRQ